MSDEEQENSRPEVSSTPQGKTGFLSRWSTFFFPVVNLIRTIRKRRDSGSCVLKLLGLFLFWCYTFWFFRRLYFHISYKPFAGEELQPLLVRTCHLLFFGPAMIPIIALWSYLDWLSYAIFEDS